MATYKPRSRLMDRRNRAEALSSAVSRLTRPIFGKRGLADGAIAREWTTIVGKMISRHSQPDRISYVARSRTEGLLHLRVDHSAMATELQHLETQLLERINGYFGYKAVARMRLIHGPIAEPKTETSQRSRPPSTTESPKVVAQVKRVDDPELRDALQRLGEAVTYKPEICK